MVVQRCGNRSQRVEISCGDGIFVRLGAGDHGEVHDVPLRPVMVDGDDTAAVTGRQHRRHGDVAVVVAEVRPRGVLGGLGTASAQARAGP